MNMKSKEYQEAEEILKYVIESLNLIYQNDGEDITCYNAIAMDKPILNLVKIRSLMAIAENKKNKEKERKIHQKEEK